MPMRPLSIKEKERYTSQMDEFVNSLNIFIESMGLKILQITYMIPIDNDYFYFDYPWQKSKDTELSKLNKLLDNNNELITKNTQKVLKEYSSFNNLTNTCPGYIYYEYSSNSNEDYTVSKIESNFLSSINKQLLLNYLPLIHYGCYLENKYYVGDVLFNETIQSSNRLLTIYKSLEVNSLKEDDDNTIVCSFRCLDSFDFEKSDFDSKINSLLRIIESYFDSPVLHKILTNSRKSYVLGYKHNLGTKQKTLSSSINVLNKRLSEKEDYITYKRYLEEIKGIIDLYHFTHHLIFDYELTNAGFPANVLYKNSPISEIFKDFNRKFNNRKGELEISLDLETDYTPTFDIEASDFELFDILLIIWNLWNNAITYSISYVKVSSIQTDDRFQLIIANDGKIPESYSNYLNGVSVTYPDPADLDDPYHGLEIVYDLIKRNKDKFSIESTTQGNVTTINFKVELKND
jgi:hypothetical protein